MFSKKASSSTKTSSKSYYAELEQFTPDELTDGLNRLSVDRYQKFARKSAKDFVQFEPSMSAPLTSIQQHGESIQFMDFLVQSTRVDSFKKVTEGPNR